MFRRNTGSQTVYATMIDLAGVKLTTGVSVVVSEDGAAAVSGAGTLTSLGTGKWAYTPTAGEIDCVSLGVFFEHATGVTVEKTIRTTVANPDDAAGFGLSRFDAAISTRLAPTVVGRTLDVTVGGTAGIDWANVEDAAHPNALSATTIEAYLASGEASIVAGSVWANATRTLTAGTNLPTDATIADKILARNLAGGSDGGRTVQDALRVLRNRVDLSGGVITVRAENDSTVAWTGTYTTAAGNPVTGIDPA